MKYIPHRKCIACRTIHPKNEMIRISKTSEGIYQLDEHHTADGRGAYLCRKEACIKQAIQKKALHQSFKTKVSEECYDMLRTFAEEQLS